METDSATAREHPLINEFSTLVCNTVGDGLLDFRDLQDEPFLKFWKHLIIYRYEPEINDFRVIFYGSHVVSMYGADYTNKLLSEMGFHGAFKDVFTLNMRIINGERRVYASGDLFWQEKEYRKWHQVKMPLKRKDSVNEILICMDIS